MTSQQLLLLLLLLQHQYKKTASKPSPSDHLTCMQGNLEALFILTENQELLRLEDKEESL